VRFAFISTKKDDFPVDWMCRRLEVSTSGFYRWRNRDESARTRSDRRLGTIVRSIHVASHKTYGSPRVHRVLLARGERVGRKRVARVMRENGLTGSRPRRFKATTNSAHQLPVAPNVVARDFSPPARNHTWAADITYVRTWSGWLYLAVVIDLYSRRVVGWSVADHMRTGLVTAALNMAVAARKPPHGLVMHSDRGGQYALELYGMTCSMSRKGDCWDNAVVESFFGTLKQELIYRRKWPTKVAAAEAIRFYINRFYNVRRRHSALGYVSPLEFEMSRRVSLAA
jgi:putative transposase